MLSQTRQRSTSKTFVERLPSLRSVHSQAVNDVLPAALDELRTTHGIEPSEETVEWLEDWLNDLGQLFRLYKKLEFDEQATLEALHQAIVWRTQNLLDLPSPQSACRFLRFIPHPLITSSDSSSTLQPILPLSLKELTIYANDKSTSFDDKVEEVKRLMMNSYELARLYLRDLDAILKSRLAAAPGPSSSQFEDDADDTGDRMRILQFVLMVDVQGAGMLPNMGTDIANWVTKDLAPNYPGLCSAVYIVNYSWAYSAMWALVKRVLPEKVLSRISFPSTSELLEYFSPESLPKEHGGSMPPLSADYDEVMERYYPKITSESHDESASSSSTVVPADDVVRPSPSSESLFDPPPPPVYLSSYAPSNPFYGYPAVIHYRRLPDGSLSTSGPQLVHGRRRKRDLAKTLTFLFILQWRKKMQVWIGLLAGAVRRLQMSAAKKVVTFKTVGRVVGVPALMNRRVSLAVALCVLLTAIIVRLKRVAQTHGYSGLWARLTSPEMTWVARDALTLTVGGLVGGLGLSTVLAPTFVLPLPAI